MTDQEIIEQYAQQNPNCVPANNPDLRAAVNDPGYEDRGLWGPYGGPLGTVSQVWLADYRLQTGK